MGLPWRLSGKEPACQSRRLRFDPWVGKIPWRRKWQPTPVHLPGKSHGQRSLVGYSPQGHKESDTTEQLTSNKARKDTRTGWSCISLSQGTPGPQSSITGLQAPGHSLPPLLGCDSHPQGGLMVLQGCWRARHLLHVPCCGARSTRKRGKRKKKTPHTCLFLQRLE